MPELRSYPNRSIRWRWDLSEPITWFRPWSIYSNNVDVTGRDPRSFPRFYFRKELPEVAEWLDTKVGLESKAWGVTITFDLHGPRYFVFFRNKDTHMRFVMRWRHTVD